MAVVSVARKHLQPGRACGLHDTTPPPRPATSACALPIGGQRKRGAEPCSGAQPRVASCSRAHVPTRDMPWRKRRQLQLLAVARWLGGTQHTCVPRVRWAREATAAVAVSPAASSCPAPTSCSTRRSQFAIACCCRCTAWVTTVLAAPNVIVILRHSRAL